MMSLSISDESIIWDKDTSFLAQTRKSLQYLTNIFTYISLYFLIFPYSHFSVSFSDIRLSILSLYALSALTASCISPTYIQVPLPYVQRSGFSTLLTFAYSSKGKQRTWYNTHADSCRKLPHEKVLQRFAP